MAPYVPGRWSCAGKGVINDYDDIEELNRFFKKFGRYNKVY